MPATKSAPAGVPAGADLDGQQQVLLMAEEE
jgi:hypothetical protein